jgi:anti-sigma factor RsiW
MSADDRERDEAPPFEGAGDALPSSDELELFAYLDGELDDDAAARFEERVGGDPELAAKLTAMGAIADFVRDDAARIYGAARVDTIVDDVLAKLAPRATAPAPPVPLRLAPVVEIAASQSTRFGRSRSTSVVWIGGALAVAAAVALFVGTRRDPIGAPPVAAASAKPTAAETASETVAVNVVPTASRAVDPPLPAAGTPGVEVEDLEVGEGATVIYTGSAQGAVVWVNDKR